MHKEESLHYLRQKNEMCLRKKAGPQAHSAGL